ncbi:Integral membrane protease of the rhomboid family involved in different forms of regulated intramembrane proteolysis [Phaffia rhodozyma]|uniref:Integral membrane protease of the rhomboid family involved in different forms of regulated intramembrane proteolysis n=1 Tax=Phaffia rhodozyma TaxID=264483 RepID=A0A0F7SP14_PHARH|nr:Integral membrane protease of the rhomboid family involved in different forms of regulated intramembrane proteolysis [Phaffia rhodozyma]
MWARSATSLLATKGSLSCSSSAFQSFLRRPPPPAIRQFSLTPSLFNRLSRPLKPSRYASRQPHPIQQPLGSVGASPAADRTPIGRITPTRVSAAEAIDGGGRHTREGSLLTEHEFDGFDEEGARSSRDRNVFRPLIWSLAVVGGVYVGAALLTNADTDLWAEKLGAGSFWRRNLPSQKEMMDAKRLELMRSLQSTVQSLQRQVASFPDVFKTLILQTYVSVAEYWLNTSEAKRFATVVVGVNGLIFLGFRSPRLKHKMMEAFRHTPSSGKSYTLLTSAFAHSEFWHFGFNMFALWSFMPSCYAFLVHGDRHALSSFPGMAESTAIYHLAAFYVAAGIFASLGSHLYVNLFTLPRFLSSLRQSALLHTPLPRLSLLALARQTGNVPTLGASGALYAIFALSALSFPHASVGVIFLPFVSLPITWGFGAMIGFDILGLIRGWKMFNHVAHLSGAIFGAVYWRYGCDLWDWLRMTLSNRPAKRPAV